MIDKLIEAKLPRDIAEVLALAIEKFVLQEGVQVRTASVKFEVHCTTTDHRTFAIGHRERVKL